MFPLVVWKLDRLVEYPFKQLLQHAVKQRTPRGGYFPEPRNWQLYIGSTQLDKHSGVIGMTDVRRRRDNDYKAADTDKSNATASSYLLGVSKERH